MSFLKVGCRGVSRQNGKPFLLSFFFLCKCGVYFVFYMRPSLVFQCKCIQMFLYSTDLKRCRIFLNHSVSWCADRLGDFVEWALLLAVDAPIQSGWRFGDVEGEV